MEMICINCPMGCMMTLEQKDGEINVKGNGCKRGIQYAIEECTAPTRMLTSSVYVTGGSFPAVSYTHLTLPTKYNSCRSRWSPYH